MAEKEVTASASIWNGEYLVNQEATEENFKIKAKEATIIHIASHTIIDDEEPMNSKLVFSPGADTIEDGLLHTYELYNMQLNAQLACLSACNTGFGQIKSGEGVVSLAKGFFYAGIPNVMMSLWSVPDISTSEIMTAFYKELRRGIGKADALRNAKLKYLQEADSNTSDPYYWAAFTMIGDNQSIQIKDQPSIWFWIIPILTIIGITFVILKKRL
jgi:CHAT domain-containing protein